MGGGGLVTLVHPVSYPLLFAAVGVCGSDEREGIDGEGGGGRGLVTLVHPVSYPLLFAAVGVCGSDEREGMDGEGGGGRGLVTLVHDVSYPLPFAAAGVCGGDDRVHVHGGGLRQPVHLPADEGAGPGGCRVTALRRLSAGRSRGPRAPNVHQARRHHRCGDG